MFNNLFNNQILRALAIFGLSAFSIIATAFGFRLLIGESNSLLAWIAAFSVQVILVGAALLVFRIRELRNRIISLLVYLMAIIFSVSGSFFTFDSWLSQLGRSSRVIDEIYNDVAYYAENSAKAVASRQSLLDQELAKIDQFLIDEDEIGIASYEGAGKGPMYRAVMTNKKALSSLQNRLSDIHNQINDIWLNNTYLAAGKIKNSQMDFKRMQQEAELLVERIRLATASAPSDESINTQLVTLYQLINRTRYGSVFEKPTISTQYPTFHKSEKDEIGSAQEIVAGALKDLKGGNLTTIVALFAAIILDGLILLIAILDSLFEVNNSETLMSASTVTSQNNGNIISIHDIAKSMNETRRSITKKKSQAII